MAACLNNVAATGLNPAHSRGVWGKQNMTIQIGYIGVINVSITKETFFDNNLVVITGEDPAHEVPGFERETKGLRHAWNQAVAEVKRRGGTVMARPPKPGKFRLLGGTSDITEVPQTDLVSWDDAMDKMDAMAGDLEYGLCSGWKRADGPKSITFTDQDGYEMKLRIITEAEDNRLRETSYPKW